MILFNKKNKHRKFTEASPSKSTINKNTYKKLLVKAASLISGASGNRAEMTPPEYDFDEIKMACESDSYVKASYMKYSYMLFKAGYKLESENEAAREYIKQRLNAISFATRQPVDILFQECGDDLLKFSNAVLIKSRTKQLMPGVKAQGFFKDQPVGGYFRADLTTLSVKKDGSGAITKYVQSINGDEKEFDVEDVVHLYLDKDADKSFGTPRMIAALEDVKLLRRIEGNVVALIYRFAMPLFHVIIGKPQTGFQATNKEITEAEDKINQSSLDGTIITNEKTEIKSVGAEGTALNAQGYLKYFEQRVFSALGVSESQMGRGGAKQDADSMESQAHDTVKHIQRIMSIFIQEYILNELLLEGGFNPIMNEDDKVKFIFNEINIETKIKVENHEMVKYQSNMISFEEMRRSLGKKETVDENSLYKFKIEVEADNRMTDKKTEGSLELAKVAATARTANGNGTNKSTAPNNDAKSKNTPSNQHGTSSVKVKEAKTITNRKLKPHKEDYNSVYNKYYKICADIIESSNKKDDMDIIIPLGLDNMLAEIGISLNMVGNQGIEEAIKEVRKDNTKYLTYTNFKLNDSIIREEAKIRLTSLLKDVKKRINQIEDLENNLDRVEAIFISLEYRIRVILEFIMPKAYWYAYLRAGEELKYTHAKVSFNGSKDEEDHSEIIDLKAINLEDIPPYHPFCDCTIKFMKGEI